MLPVATVPTAAAQQGCEVMGDDGSAEGRAAAFVFDGENCGYQDGDDYFRQVCGGQHL